MDFKYICEKCDYKCFKTSDWNKHVKTQKHVGKPEVSKKVAACELCDYKCCKQSLMDKHKMTNKHKEKVASIPKTTISSAVDHPQIVSSENGSLEKLPGLSLNYFMSMISQLLNQNNELKNFIIEQASEHKKETREIMNKVIENVKPATTNNNTVNGNVNNTQTNKFNINVFLNEHCKDAMNLSDFIKNIEVSREDLENNAQLGFVGGISKIFLDNLRQLSINERPIHCTDVKRETMYIKDDDKWTKETGPGKLNLVIQTITQKSTRTLLDWKKENPDYNDHDSEFSTRCIVIQRNSMAGHARDIYYPKVIHAIAREVIVNK